MWAQEWTNIFDILIPYPNAASTNLTKILLEKNFTPIGIHKQAEEFFVSIGLYPMTDEFWNNSMLVKPNDRDVLCHAAAFTISDPLDYRVKMCTSVSDNDLLVSHHEMGHIEYYMAYKDQPTIFRNGANSGFHEAIGDAIALSVDTNKHLKAIGLIEKDDSDYEEDINTLMFTALGKIAFLPFGYMMDKYRFDIFRGKTTPDEYNKKWWQIR
jgi:peptidyl-dipeptidase A